MKPPIPTRDDRIRDFNFELDQMYLQLVLSDHPEWQRPDGSCPPCWLEVQRLRAETGEAGVLDA